jgi:hypothetical protein
LAVSVAANPSGRGLLIEAERTALIRLVCPLVITTARSMKPLAFRSAPECRPSSRKTSPRVGRVVATSAIGSVSRTCQRKEVRCCTRDEGGPLEAGGQAQASSRCKLLLSRAMVVSVAETSGHDPGRYDAGRRAQANRRRSVESGLDDVETGGFPFSRDKLEG